MERGLGWILRSGSFKALAYLGVCLCFRGHGEWQREERIEGEGSARCISVVFEFQLLLFSVSLMNH